MGPVTFDPERVALLGRELDRLAQRLEVCSHLAVSDDVARVVMSARRLVDEQIARVDASLVAIRDMNSRRVDTAVAEYHSWAGAASHWWTQATTKESTRSDDILRTFDGGDDPMAAGHLIDALPNLELLVAGTVDLSLVESIWVAATDPSTTSPHVAGRRIRRLLDVVHGPKPWERGLAGGSIDPVQRARRDIAVRELTARISAPWQLHFSRTDGIWPWSGADGTHHLHHMSALESASDILVQGLARALRLSLANLPDDPAQRLAEIDAVAGAVGSSLEVRRMAEVDRAREASDLDTLREVIGTLALDGPWPISMVVDAGARWVGDFFDTSEARIREATLENLHHREVLASIAVLAVFTSALGRSRRHDSRTSLVGGDSNTNTRLHLATELRHTYQAIDNAASRGQSLAQLTSPRP